MKIVIQQYNIMKLKISIIFLDKFNLFRKISPETFSPPCKIQPELEPFRNSVLTMKLFKYMC